MKRIVIWFCLFLVFATQAQTITTSLVYITKAPSIKSEKTPVLILLHGYGSNESDLFDISNSLDGRLMTFSLRAPMPLQDNGFCWYKLGEAPDRSLKYDYKEVKVSRALVLDFIKKACRAYHLDSTSVYLLGFSQGAILSYDLALSSPGKIKGVMALSGRLMVESKTQCNNWPAMKNTRFFIAHGNFDNMISKKEAHTANEFLLSKGLKEVTYTTYDMQHTINGKELNDIKIWLSKSLNTVLVSEPKKATTNSSKK